MKIKKTIAAIAAAAMVFTSIPMIAFAVDHDPDSHTAKSDWVSTDDSKHWKECSTAECEYKYDEEDHQAAADLTFALEGGKHVKKCKCGKVIEQHDPDETGEYTTTAENHKKLCAADGCTIAVVTEAAHTPAYDTDGTAEDGEHAVKCSVCGKTGLTAAACTPSGWKKDANGHWKVCNVCGKEISETAAAHDAATGDEAAEWVKSKTQHWKVCSCDYVIVEAAEHVYDQADDKCVCGLTESTAASEAETTAPENPETGDPRPVAPHVHAAADTWTKDATHHWKLCTADGCELAGKIMTETKAAHDWSSSNTCVCGATKPEEGGSNNEGSGGSSGSDSSSSESSSSSTSSSAPAATVASTPAEVRSATKPNVTVDAAATEVTPAMVKAFTKNSKTKTMTLDYGKNVKVAIAKDDVKDAAKANLDFSVSGKNFISSKAIKSNKTLSKAEKVVQMDFVQEGKFNGIDKVTVKNRVGGKYAGQTATVYEYVNGKLVKVAVTKVGGSGLVSFKIDHFGQYVIVVDAPAKGVTKASAKADEK